MLHVHHDSTVVAESRHAMDHLNLTEDLSGDRAVSDHGFEHLDD